MEPLQYINIALATLEQIQYLSKILWCLLGSILISEVLFKYFPSLLRRFGAPLKPIVKTCNLPPETASILISSIGSSLIANAAIINLRNNNKLSERQTINAALLNSIPTYFRRLFTIYLIVLAPLFGIKFSLGFTLVYCSAIIPKYLFSIIYGKNDKKAKYSQPIEKMPLSETARFNSFHLNQFKNNILPFLLNSMKIVLPAVLIYFASTLYFQLDASYFISWYALICVYLVLKISIKKFSNQLKMFKKIAISMVVLTFMTLFIINTPLIKHIEFLIMPLINFLSLNKNLSIPLLTFISGQLIAGVGVLNSLVVNGMITNTDALLALTAGLIINLPVFTFKHILPSYVSVFGRKIGIKIVLISFSIVLISRCLMFALLLMLLN